MADTHECDGGCALKRRDFLGAAAVAALALLQGACGDGQIGPSAPRADDDDNAGGGGAAGSGALIVSLAAFPALASVGGVARVDGGSGLPVALVRTGAASFAAFSLRCPHQGFTVEVQGGSFRCPAHGARFNSSGTWTGGQPTSNLTVLPSVFNAGAGTVSITR
ncbi:MAG: Rieske (2Fe-2S) protein [Gemmatimonadetes bacterium]|nr:Rieske (2Fe-2S) protein [Gemmatimonadota bacterium]